MCDLYCRHYKHCVLRDHATTTTICPIEASFLSPLSTETKQTEQISYSRVGATNQLLNCNRVLCITDDKTRRSCGGRYIPGIGRFIAVRQVLLSAISPFNAISGDCHRRCSWEWTLCDACKVPSETRKQNKLAPICTPSTVEPLAARMTFWGCYWDAPLPPPLPALGFLTENRRRAKTYAKF